MSQENIKYVVYHHGSHPGLRADDKTLNSGCLPTDTEDIFMICIVFNSVVWHLFTSSGLKRFLLEIFFSFFICNKGHHE